MEQFFKNPQTLLRMREGPLGNYIGSFAKQLTDQGYARYTARYQLQLVANFSRWLDQQRVIVNDITPEHIRCYLQQRAQQRRIREGDAFALQRLLDLLRQEGVIAEKKDRFADREVDLSVLCAADVVGFVQRQAACLHPKRAKVMTTALRSFLQYARYRGDVNIDLAAAVPTVANWVMASIPRLLSPDQVELVLAHCNRRTAIGRRDYAILLLLARLGLRAGEVAALTLDDIDWKAGHITVRGKGGQWTQMPLLVDVGEGIAAAEIGELLRHRSPQTTAIYAKVDLTSLRTLALPWPGGAL